MGISWDIYTYFHDYLEVSENGVYYKVTQVSIVSFGCDMEVRVEVDASLRKTWEKCSIYPGSCPRWPSKFCCRIHTLDQWKSNFFHKSIQYYHVLPCITMYDLYSSHPKALFWLHPLKSRHLRHDSPGTTTSSSPGLESEVESATSWDGFLATAYEADDGKAGLGWLRWSTRATATSR